MLRPGVLLPPSMRSRAEIEALLLGTRGVSTLGERTPAAAALFEIESLLPQAGRHVPLRIGSARPESPAQDELSDPRDATRHERELEIACRGADRREGRRVDWPFAIGHFTDGRILLGRCKS